MRITRLLIVFTVLWIGLTPITAPALSNPTFELISPFFKQYVFETDYKLFIETPGTFPSAPGDVTADLQFAGFGAVPGDFAGFVSGNIALIERNQPVLFSTKVNNAASFGAIGAIIFDNGTGFTDVTLAAETFIPSIFTTDTVGAELLGLLSDTQGPVIVHLEIPAPSEIPEPTTMILLGTGFLGLWGLRRKFKA